MWGHSEEKCFTENHSRPEAPSRAFHVAMPCPPPVRLLCTSSSPATVVEWIEGSCFSATELLPWAHILGGTGGAGSWLGSAATPDCTVSPQSLASCLETIGESLEGSQTFPG